MRAQAKDARARRAWTCEGKGSRIARCSTSIARSRCLRETLCPARRRRRREPPASPPAHRAPTLLAASPASPTGPLADRDARDPNVLATRGRDCRATRDGSPVASCGMAPLVALSLPPSGRPVIDRRRVEGPDPAYVAREPPVGGEPDCRRAREARLARLAAHGREVPPEAPGTWPGAALEDLSPEARLVVYQNRIACDCGDPTAQRVGYRRPP
jgi:hypothetical protein